MSGTGRLRIHQPGEMEADERGSISFSIGIEFLDLWHAIRSVERRDGLDDQPAITHQDALRITSAAHEQRFNRGPLGHVVHSCLDRRKVVGDDRRPCERGDRGREQEPDRQEQNAYTAAPLRSVGAKRIGAGRARGACERVEVSSGHEAASNGEDAKSRTSKFRECLSTWIWVIYLT